MNYSPMEWMQDNVLGRLLADGPLSTVTIFEERKGVRTNDLQQALATNSNYRSGTAKGAAIIVGMPFRRVSDPLIPGPRIDPEFVVRCMEKPLVNRGPGGTGLTAEFLSIRVEQLLHNWLLRDLSVTLRSDGADPIAYETGEREYENHFKTDLQLKKLCKPAIPIISIADGTATITCGSAGALVYYTLDGSFPYAGNGTAILYAAPFAIAGGTMLKAVSFFPDPTPEQASSDLAAQYNP